jgi:hypothetical protein
MFDRISIDPSELVQLIVILILIIGEFFIFILKI